MPSQIKVDQIAGASGNTVTVPSGQTLDISSATLSLPSTIVTTTGTQTLTNKTIGVSQLTGTLPVANGGTGLTTLGSASQVLRVNSGATGLEFGTLTTGANAGEIIQVKSATDSTTRTTTSTSYVTASNTLTVSITPSATANKIFIIVNASYTYNSAYTLRLTVYRDATNLASNAFVANHTGSTELPLSFSYLDSPNTTSAITYQVYIKTSGGTANLNEANGISTITCMEVKG